MPLLRFFLLSAYLLTSHCLAEELTFYSGNQSALTEQAFAKLQKALNQLGHQANYSIVATRRSLQIANTIGDGDLIRVAELHSLFPNLTNNLLRVEEPLMTIEFVEVSKIALPINLALSDKIAILKDVHILEHRYPQAVIMDGYEKLFEMLKMDKVEKIIFPVSNQEEIRQDPLFTTNYTLRTIDTQKLYTYIHKKHADIAVQLALVLKTMNTTEDELKQSQASSVTATH